MGNQGNGYDAGMVDPGLEGIGTAIIIFWAIYMIFVLVWAVAFYVMQGMGLYTVAKRRCLSKPWLAWIPVGNMWILGSLSDQYQYVVKGKVRNFRKVLLGMTVAVQVISFLNMIVTFVAGFNAAMYGGAYAMFDSLTVMAIVTIGFGIVMLVVAIVLAVLEYICIYDYYRSCDPDNAVLFLILSIFFAGLLPIFLFAARKKDLGMPPRIPEEPVQPVTPQFFEPQPAEPQIFQP